MLIIGSHVSFKAGNLLTSVKEAISYNANTFMFYTGAPTSTIRTPIDKNTNEEAIRLMNENNIDINNVICHAPYIINPATYDEEKRNFAISFLSQEIKRCEALGIKYIVLHPGSSVGTTKEEALRNISEVLNRVLDNNTNVMILLETMAGKGNECGTTTEEIQTIMSKVNKIDNVGVCLDTCHLNDAGYDISNFNNYLEEFDKLIGINKIKCVHINDSKNPISSHKDRHENIGKGTIGFNNLINVIYNDRLKDIPKILETPYIGDNDDDKERIYPPYKYEIAMIRKQEFNNNLYEDIRNEYRKK